MIQVIKIEIYTSWMVRLAKRNFLNFAIERQIDDYKFDFVFCFFIFLLLTAFFCRFKQLLCWRR